MKQFNKKEIIKILIIILLVIVLSLVAILPINKNYNSNAWMKDLSDDTVITEMSIPGTHDSGALHSIFDVAGKCQDVNIKNQLNMGVRFLDIRLQLENNELYLVHSFVKQNTSFSKVLDIINDFISENKSEFLIISIKEDADSINSDIDFNKKVYEMLSEHQMITFDTSLPKTLKDARGKVYILNRFSSDEIGIPAYNGWLDSTSFEIDKIYVQDNYCISDINDKIHDIKNTFNYCENNKEKLVFNFTSCYLDNGFPPLYAGTAAKTINKWLVNELDNFEGHVGIMIMDFVTSEMVEAVYMRNNYEAFN